MKKAIRVSGLPSCRYIPLHSGHSQGNRIKTTPTSQSPAYLRRSHPRVVLLSVGVQTSKPRVVLLSVGVQTSKPRVVLLSVGVQTLKPRVVLLSVGVQTSKPRVGGISVGSWRVKKAPQVCSYLGAVALGWAALPLSAIQSSLYLWRPK